MSSHSPFAISLTHLRLPDFVIASRHTGLNKASSATLVDAKYVKNAFTENTSKLQTIFIVKKFTAAAIFKVLRGLFYF